MATRFVRGVLRVINRLYDFQGDSPVSLFDQSSPIQRVHEVARQAELGSGVGRQDGYLVHVEQQAHVGVGTIYGELTFAEAAALQTEYPLAELGVWLMAFSVTISDTADFDNATLGYIDRSTSAPMDLLLARYTSQAVAIRSGGGVQAIAGASTLGNVVAPARLPFPLLPNGSIACTSVADNLGTTQIDFNLLLWMGARGSRPPGVA